MSLPVQIANNKTAKAALSSIDRSNETRPTEDAYGDLLLAFHWFNEKLFDNALSAPLITLARKPRMLGAFHADRFENKNGVRAHEIILNPHYLARRSDTESLSTLVHEMVHQWRVECAPLVETQKDKNDKAQNKKAPSGGYHDALWADGMERVGLMPSDTGEPGGKRTGPRVSHYIMEGGRFAQAVNALLDRGFVIRWSDRIKESKAADTLPVRSREKQQRASARIKFTCSACGLNAWAKPSATLKCAPCDQSLNSISHEDKQP